MFNMSLADNITISSSRKNLPRLGIALRTAALNPVIRKFPQGFRTLIGEKGYRVSGGERQRVGIARAVYKDSDVIILDEATSSLDSKTEMLIQQRLARQLSDKTLLIIAHRLSTLRDVDSIVFMERGRVVESGSFKDLIKLKGKFASLYKLQSQRV